MGKTAVAHKICNISNGSFICVDPDKYFNDNIKRYWRRGGPISRNTLMKEDIYKEVKNQIHKANVIIPLTLNSLEDTEKWFECYRDIADLRHVILYADEDTLIKRINGQEGRDKEGAIDNIEINKKYYNNNIPGAIKIDTSEMSVSEVAQEILRLIN